MTPQEILDQLRADTAVFRTTLRLEDGDFAIAAESLGEGADSLAGPLPFDLRTTGTYQWVAKERRILVQSDVRAGPNPPRELFEVYGVGSQMLSGLFDDDGLVGIISVHHAATTREWTDAEIAALERATAAMKSALARDSD
jgi:GAF domain-containing protein